MKKIALFTIFLFCTSLLFGVTYNTPTIDGSIAIAAGDWDSDELIVDDPNNDSAWGASNEMNNLWLTWDANNLYIGIEYTASNNAMIVYLEMSIVGGETDFNSDNGYQGAYPRNITFNSDDAIDLMIAGWNSVTPGVWTVTNNHSTDISGSCTISGTTSSEVEIPWNSIYGLEVGTVPEGASLKIVGVIAGGNNWGACDSAPDNTDTDGDGGPDHLTNLWSITIDSNSDGTPDSGVTLPVELSTFTAQYLNSTPTLYWETQSETDNMGWFVYRNKVEDFTSATKVSGMIEGHGTTTQMQSYIYEDVIANPQVGDVYYYWLESVDYSGTIHHFDKMAMITIPETNDPNQNITPPPVYDLLSLPNPFNQYTNISFMLTQSAMVDVEIYDVKGALVKSFGTQHVTANDEVLLKWYGNDENGKSLPNGIYLYSVKVDGQEYSTKRVILMK